MAKPSPDPATSPRILVLELWGLGDLALAIPFLQAAAGQGVVSVVAKAEYGTLLHKFVPTAKHIPLTAPWTRFAKKYQLWSWPWKELEKAVRKLRATSADIAVSARPDPRDHVLLALSGARRRLGFGSLGSAAFLTQSLARPANPHRAAHWQGLADTLGWSLTNPDSANTRRRRLVIHTGAAQPVRQWPRDRFVALAARLRTSGWEVDIIDETVGSLDDLLARLAAADRFIGNDSGPGHLAALLGIPTFTIFGPQLPASFAPVHPRAAWIEGAPCVYKPCFDHCRFTEPLCLTSITVESVITAVTQWLAGAPSG